MSNIGEVRTTAEIQKDWGENPRWEGITRDYTTEQIVELRDTVVKENTLARHGAEVLWGGINVKDDSYISALSTLTGNMAVQQARVDLKAAYLSNWQVAGDANLSGHTYPDQFLYPANSVPNVVRRINNALLHADEIARIEGDNSASNWLLPIVTDGEADFSGALNVYKLQKAVTSADAADTRWEDQLVSEKKYSYLDDEVPIPIQQHVRILTPARLTADVSSISTVIITRTDTETATFITFDVDERDQKFITGDRTPEGSYRLQNGLEPCIGRAKPYAPYANMIWMETGAPSLELAKKFVEDVKVEYPDQLLAHNCSPPFNWSAHLEKDEIARFQNELGKTGFRFQFVILADLHALNYDMLDLAYGYAREQISALVDLQNREFEATEKRGFTAVKHQREVDAGCPDHIATTVDPNSSATALRGSTEKGQF